MTRAALALLVAALACGKSADSGPPRPPSAADVLAEVEAAKSLPTDRYVSTTAGFDLDLPGIWKGRYRPEERRDTTSGARLEVLFNFVPDSGSKAPSFSLMTMRIFTRAAWKAASPPGSLPIGSVVGESGDDVFVLSLPHANPYPTGSPEAAAYDRLIISIAQGGQQVHLTPHPKQ